MAPTTENPLRPEWGTSVIVGASALWLGPPNSLVNGSIFSLHILGAETEADHRYWLVSMSMNAQGQLTSIPISYIGVPEFGGADVSAIPATGSPRNLWYAGKPGSATSTNAVSCGVIKDVSSSVHYDEDSSNIPKTKLPDLTNAKVEASAVLGGPPRLGDGTDVAMVVNGGVLANAKSLAIRANANSADNLTGLELKLASTWRVAATREDTRAWMLAERWPAPTQGERFELVEFTGSTEKLLNVRDIGTTLTVDVATLHNTPTFGLYALPSGYLLFPFVEGNPSCQRYEDRPLLIYRIDGDDPTAPTLRALSTEQLVPCECARESTWQWSYWSAGDPFAYLLFTCPTLVKIFRIDLNDVDEPTPRMLEPPIAITNTNPRLTGIGWSVKSSIRAPTVCQTWFEAIASDADIQNIHCYEVQ